MQIVLLYAIFNNAKEVSSGCPGAFLVRDHAVDALHLQKKWPTSITCTSNTLCGCDSWLFNCKLYSLLTGIEPFTVDCIGQCYSTRIPVYIVFACSGLCYALTRFGSLDWLARSADFNSPYFSLAVSWICHLRKGLPLSSMYISHSALPFECSDLDKRQLT